MAPTTEGVGEEGEPFAFADRWRDSLKGKSAKDLAKNAVRNAMEGVPRPEDITGPGGYVERVDAQTRRPRRPREPSGNTAKDQFQETEDDALDPYIDGRVTAAGAAAVLGLLFVFIVIIGPPPST